MTLRESLALLRRDRAQLERTLIALAVIAVSLYLGVTARKRTAPIKAQLTEMTAVSQKVSAFSAGFRPLPAADENRLVLAADSVNVAMPPGSRLVVGQMIASEAEATGLRDVRVRFSSTADSAFVPPRGTGPGAPKAADYFVIVEGHGAYSQLLALLSRLPAGVAVVRLSGATTKTDTGYHVTLAVYEAPNGQPG